MLMTVTRNRYVFRTQMIVWVLLLAILFTVGTVTTVIAQGSQGGSICITAYNDLNRSQSRDPGEPLLKDIEVDLTFADNILIANHITDGTEPYCFPNLAFQKYAVQFKSSTYEATTPAGIEVMLSSDNPKADLQFGAVAKVAPTPDSSAQQGPLTVRLTTPLRLGFSVLGAILVMGFLLGVGMVIYGLFWRR